MTREGSKPFGKFTYEPVLDRLSRSKSALSPRILSKKHKIFKLLGAITTNENMTATTATTTACKQKQQPQRQQE